MSKTYTIRNNSKLSYLAGPIYLTAGSVIRALPEDMITDDVINCVRVYKGVVLTEDGTDTVVAAGPKVEAASEVAAPADQPTHVDEPAEEVTEDAVEEEVEVEEPEEEETETEEDEPVEEAPEEEDDEDSAGSDWEDEDDEEESSDDEEEASEEGSVDLDAMSDEELIAYAKDNGIKLGRTKKREKVIEKILEATQ